MGGKSEYYAGMKRIYIPVYPVLILALALCFSTMAQQKTVKSVPPVGTGAIDGKSLYQEFCAVCHGKDARGTGPASSALKVSPGDLTQLAHRNNGKFPESRVLAVLNGDAPATAHGNREMPVWGKALNDMSSNLSVAQGRKHALVNYLEEIQTK
jgi:mono/diheme cytochrome c family protein